jgi:hypothetical protein
LAEKIRTIPSNLPDIISLPISLSVAVAVDVGEVGSAGGATASGRRWRNGRREVDEPGRCNLFLLHCRRALLPLRRTPSPPSSLQTAGESRLETRKTTPYRFGLD